MQSEIFLFGAAMLVLIVLAAFLVIRAMRSTEKPADIERRMRELYIKTDELLDAAEAYIEQSKSEIAEKLDSMQSIMYRMEEMYLYADQSRDKAHGHSVGRDYHSQDHSQVRLQDSTGPSQADEVHTGIQHSQPHEALNREFRKQIKEMSSEGASTGKIAEELGSSKGAVEFVLNLMGKDNK